MCLLIEKYDKRRILLPSEIRKAEKLKEGASSPWTQRKSESNPETIYSDCQNKYYEWAL
jgi:bifunctional DNA-binding transcriptional regulator/antitoxin component of YhaV-PrlF toxin-antitoxin module